MKFDDVNKLEDAEIIPGERWIYIADFNVDPPLDKGCPRIDTEIEDLKQLVSSGAKTFILAHKGRFGDDPVPQLEFVVDYLAKKLDTNVKYYPDNADVGVLLLHESMNPGEVVIAGNSRKWKGEEENDPLIGEHFSMLGKKVAVGGFGKAHREHASNVGILNFIRGYATRSQLREMELLEDWAGKRYRCAASIGKVEQVPVYSVAVLGGIKKEKITVGLKGFLKTYDAVIPGGIVLNNIYAAFGKEIGASVIHDGKEDLTAIVKKMMTQENLNKLCIPFKAVIAKKTNGGYADSRIINITDGMPSDYSIIDYELRGSAVNALNNAVKQNGRIVLAGTPGLHNKGFSLATNKVMEYMNQEGTQSIVLGGDTAKEVNFDGPVSTGGGSALYYVANGTTPVYEALKRNKEKFGGK